MATTDVSICSNALLLIGHGTIASFTEGGAGAEVASNLYPTTYENILSLHRWRFASAKAQLSQLVADPLNEWTHAYQLPSGYLTVIKTYPDSDFEIYEDKLYSDQATVEIDYLFKPSEARLPAYFIKALEFALAAQFAIPVTSNKSTGELYLKMYLDQLRKARYMDSQARPPSAILDSPFTEVR